MNKGLFALAAATLFSVAGQTQAKQKFVCLIRWEKREKCLTSSPT